MVKLKKKKKNPKYLSKLERGKRNDNFSDDKRTQYLFSELAGIITHNQLNFNLID